MKKNETARNIQALPYLPLTDDKAGINVHESNLPGSSTTEVLLKIARVSLRQHLGRPWQNIRADIDSANELATFRLPYTNTTLAELHTQFTEQGNVLTEQDSRQLLQYIRLQPHKDYSKLAAAFSVPAAVLFGAIPAAAYANALVKLFGTGSIAICINVPTSLLVFFASGIVEKAVFQKNIAEFFLIRAGLVHSDTLEECLSADDAMTKLRAHANTISQELQHEFSIVEFAHANHCRYAAVGVVSFAAGAGGTIFAYNEIVKIINFHMFNYLSQYSVPKALALGALINTPSAITTVAGTLFRGRQSIEIGMNEDGITLANIKAHPFKAFLSFVVGTGAFAGLAKTAYESLDADAGIGLNSTGFSLMIAYSAMESTLFASKMFNITTEENWHQQLDKLFSGYGFMLALHLLAGIMPFIEGYIEDENQYLSVTLFLMTISCICEPVGEFFKDYPAIADQGDLSLSAGCHEFCMPGHSHAHNHGHAHNHTNHHGHSHAGDNHTDHHDHSHAGGNHTSHHTQTHTGSGRNGTSHHEHSHTGSSHTTHKLRFFTPVVVSGDLVHQPKATAKKQHIHCPIM